MNDSQQVEVYDLSDPVTVMKEEFKQITSKPFMLQYVRDKSVAYTQSQEADKAMISKCLAFRNIYFMPELIFCLLIIKILLGTLRELNNDSTIPQDDRSAFSNSYCVEIQNNGDSGGDGCCQVSSCASVSRKRLRSDPRNLYSIVLHELQNPEGNCLDIVLDLMKQTRLVTNGPQISYHLMWICAVTLMSPLLRGLLLFVVNAV